MKQYQAVEDISKSIIAGGLSDAIFLKGSLAQGREDEFSNVDLYVIVSKDNFDQFLDKRLEYLSKYQQIIYYTYLFHRYPKVICVYENGLQVNLYTTRFNELSQIDDIAIVYDPKHLLNNYKKVPLSFTPVEIGEIIDSFCLTSLEFYNSYNRQDMIYSLKLANDLNADLGTFLRINYDHLFAKLGLKHMLDNIDADTKQKYMEIIKKLKYDTVLECVKRMFVLIDSYINNLPLKIAEYINFDFYLFSKRQIMSIV